MDMQIQEIQALPANFQEEGVALAIRVILATLPANMELLFYRDDTEPAVREVQYPDGRVEIARATATTGAGILEPAYPAPPTVATWRQVDIERPEILADVLLLQELRGFDDEDKHLIRIGFLSKDGRWIDSYSSTLTGDDEVLERITHWAPLPAVPLVAAVAP